MQTVKFTSHVAREKAFGKVCDEVKRVHGVSGVYGTYAITDLDFFRIRHITGVQRIAKHSNIVQYIQCEL